jgi:hypothetical protein
MAFRSRVALSLAALLFVSAVAARADQQYSVDGEDVYSIGHPAVTTHITYGGRQRLSVSHDSLGGEQFVADATYTRQDEDGKAIVHARFVQRVGKDGNFEDVADSDPDFLTILNQPFAIELDRTTMNDLRHLRAKVPFEATSPLGGARLRGFLSPVPAGKVEGIAATAVRFSARGPMTGTLPQHPTDSLKGTIQMFGTAYYSMRSALLVELDATLTIQGTLDTNTNAVVPVKIVYHRTIRAEGDGAPETAAR